MKLKRGTIFFFSGPLTEFGSLPRLTADAQIRGIFSRFNWRGPRVEKKKEKFSPIFPADIFQNISVDVRRKNKRGRKTRRA